MARHGLALVAAGTIIAALPAVGGGAAAAPPVPTVAVGSASATIGGSVTVPVTFSNPGGSTGFGPVIDVVVPVRGADGDDGLTFTSATYLGLPVRSTVVPLTACPYTHPVYGPGTPCPSGAVPGDAVVVLEPPFGSYAPTQPPASIDVTFAVSNLADEGVALPVTAVPSFRFGDQPTGSTPIVGPPLTGTVTPTLLDLTKQYKGPEGETASGPNFPRQYVLSATVPAGQRIDDLVIADELPAGIQFTSLVSTSPAAVSTTLPSTTEPGGRIEAHLGSVFDPVNPTVVSVTFSFFVPEDAATGDPVLPPEGGRAALTDKASLTGSWTPLDPRDPPRDIRNQARHTLTAKTLATQKKAAVTVDTGAKGPTPGDQVTTTITTQLSDFFRVDQLLLTDVVGDGQTVDPERTTLVVHTGTSDVTIDPRPFTTVDDSKRTSCGDGTTVVTVDVAAAMASVGLTSLTGGRFDGTVTGPAGYDVTVGSTIDTDYRCVAAPANNVNGGDRFPDDVSVSGRVIDAAGNPLGTVDDVSQDVLEVSPGDFDKAIFAINGQPPVGTPPKVTVGDVVTYRLTRDFVTGSFQELSYTDYLPQPVYDPTEVTTFDSGGGLPPAGTATFGPSNTITVPPTVSVDAANSAVRFGFGTHTAVGDTPGVLDVLFSVTITNAPFADGLLLTNLARSSQVTTDGRVIDDDAIVQVELNEPSLTISKGVVGVATTGVPAVPPVIAPSVTGPVTFAAPGSAGAPFTGIVSSTGLTTSPVDSNASGVDAGDRVRFAVVVQNVGKGSKGAFDIAIADTCPVGFDCASASGLQVVDGTGAPISFTGTASDLFAAGITLVDPGPTPAEPDGRNGGALDAYDPASGRNVAVVVYDLTVSDAVRPADVVVNTASLLSYANQEGGPSFLPAPLTDTAVVTARTVGLTKTLVSTSDPGTAGTDVVIGERVTWSVAATIPHGTTPSAVLVDDLPIGMAVLSLDGLTCPAAVTTDLAGGCPAALAAAQATIAPGSTRSVSIPLGALVNADRDDAVDEQITLRLTTVVVNVIENQQGETRRNAAAFTWVGAGGPGRADTVSDPVTIVEPGVKVTKRVVDPAGGAADAGDTVTFRIAVEHLDGTPIAHDVVLTDPVPAELVVDPSSFSATGVAPGAPGWTWDPATRTIRASWAALSGTQTSRLTFKATISPDLVIPATPTNTAKATWTSLPGADPFERTGAGGPLNDYISRSSARITVAGAITKALIDTSEPSTPGSLLTIGEVGTYSIGVSLPEGNLASGFTVTDPLPVGLTYVPGSAQVLSTGFGGTLGAVTINEPATPGAPLVVKFGPTVVTPDNDPANNGLTITLRAQVADVPTNVGIAPQTQLDNVASLRLGDGPPVVSAPTSITVVEPRLALVKSFSPSDAATGDSTTVTLTVTNVGTSSAFDTVVTDPLPAELIAPRDLTVPSGWTGSIVGTTVSVTGGPLEPTQSATFTFVVTVGPGVAAGTTVTNEASAVTTTLPGPQPGERTEPPVTARDTLNGTAPDLAITKDDGRTVTAPGEVNVYALVVSNRITSTNPGRDATGVVITDTVPNGTVFVAAQSATGWSCGDGAPAGAVCTYSVGALARGAQVSVAFAVKVLDPLPAGITQIVNTALVDDDGLHGEDPTPDDRTATDVDDIDATPIVTITKDDGRTTVAPGDRLTYTIVVRNDSSVGASGVVVHDVLPPHTTFVSASDAGGILPGTAAPTVAWPAVDIVGRGGSITRTVTVDVDQPIAAGVEELTNTASVVAGDAGRPSASDTDVVAATPDLVVTKSNGRDGLAPGETTTYTITVTNVGPQGATGVRLVDPVPASTTFVSASDGGALDTGAAVPTIVWPLFDLAGGGATVTRTITVTVADPLPAGVVAIVNTATANDDGSNGPDPTPENNTATDTDPTVADLSIVKGIDGGLVAGASATYVLTVANAGPLVAAAPITVVDTLPAGLTFVTSGSAGWACTAAAQVVTCTSPSALGVGATVELRLTVSVAPGLTGEVTNVATVSTPTPESTLANNRAERTDPVVVVPTTTQQPLQTTTTVAPGSTTTAAPPVTDDTGGPDLPFTGLEVRPQLVLGGVLVAIGLALVALGRRPRPAR